MDPRMIGGKPASNTEMTIKTFETRMSGGGDNQLKVAAQNLIDAWHDPKVDLEKFCDYVSLLDAELERERR